MKLTLKAVQPDAPQPSNNTKWSFERGRKTIGRSHDCDWQIIADDRRVSKLHCTIQRVQNTFELLDNSANGTRIDDLMLQEGESSPLRDGARLLIGQQEFLVSITGKEDFQFDDTNITVRPNDEALTISAILSDITPSSHSSAILKGAATHQSQWSDDEGSPSTNKNAISKKVQIGWNEPPVTSNSTTLLPDDWNFEPTSNSQHEHIDALSVPVKISAKRKRASQDDAPVASPIEAAPLNDESTAFEPITQNAPDPAILALLSVLEETSQIAFESLNLPVPDRQAAQASDLDERLRHLTIQQTALNGAIDNIVRLLTQQFDPRIIEASVDQKNDLRAKIERKDWRALIQRTSYWAQYRSRFDQDGKLQSVKDLIQKAARGEVDDTSKPSDENQTTVKGNPDDAT